MTNKVSIQDVVNGTPAGKEAVQRAVEASIKDQDAMSAKARAMRSDTDELEGMLFGFAKHVALQQMIANKKVNAFFQIGNGTDIDVDKTIKSISNYVERMVATKEAEAYKKGYIDGGVQAINKGYADGLTEFKGDI